MQDTRFSEYPSDVISAIRDQKIVQAIMEDTESMKATCKRGEKVRYDQHKKIPLDRHLKR